MFVLNQTKSWRPLRSAPGASILVTPLRTDDRAAALASVAHVTDPAEKALAFAEVIAIKCVHDWKGIGAIDADGKVAAVPCTPENIKALVADSFYNDEVQEIVSGAGLRYSLALEAAGNASPG